MESRGRPVVPIAISIDITDEDRLLARTLHRLIIDAPLRAALPPHLRPDPLQLATSLAGGIGVNLPLE